MLLRWFLCTFLLLPSVSPRLCGASILHTCRYEYARVCECACTEFLAKLAPNRKWRSIAMVVRTEMRNERTQSEFLFFHKNDTNEPNEPNERITLFIYEYCKKKIQIYVTTKKMLTKTQWRWWRGTKRDEVQALRACAAKCFNTSHSDSPFAVGSVLVAPDLLRGGRFNQTPVRRPVECFCNLIKIRRRKSHQLSLQVARGWQWSTAPRWQRPMRSHHQVG